MQINCPSCNRALSMPEGAMGKQVRCPLCNNVFQVGGPTAPPPAAVQPPPARQAPPPPPPRQAPQPPAYAPPPPQGGPYDYGGQPPGGGAGQAFDFQEGSDQYQPFRGAAQARAAAGWMMTAGIIDIVFCVIALIAAFVVGAAGARLGGGEAAAVGVVAFICVLVLFGTPTVFIMIGAACLRSGRNRGLVITGCVFAFIVGGVLAIFAVINLIQLLQILRFGPPPFVVLIAFLQLLLQLAAAPMNIIAGVKGLQAPSQPPPHSDYGGYR